MKPFIHMLQNFSHYETKACRASKLNTKWSDSVLFRCEGDHLRSKIATVTIICKIVHWKLATLGYRFCIISQKMVKKSLPGKTEITSHCTPPSVFSHPLPTVNSTSALTADSQPTIAPQVRMLPFFATRDALVYAPVSQAAQEIFFWEQRTWVSGLPDLYVCVGGGGGSWSDVITPWAHTVQERWVPWRAPAKGVSGLQSLLAPVLTV